jgi:integrase
MWLTRNLGQGLEKKYNAWYVRKRIPADVRSHFDGKATLFQNLETTKYAIAVDRAPKVLHNWNQLIQLARKKNRGEIIDLDEAVEVAKKKIASFKDEERGLTSVIYDMNLDKNLDNENFDPEQEKEQVKLVGLASKVMTPFTKYVDEWIEDYGYTFANGYEGKRLVKLRFSKKFKYFETISVEALKAYIKERTDGSDGARVWSDRSVEKNMSYVKQYWNWCLDNDLITTPNPIDVPRLMQKKNNTKSQRLKTKKEANHAYTVEECWRLHKTAELTDQSLADIIILSMYTGCRINELATLTLENVTEDRFLLEDTKTDAGDRGIPIHTDIQQTVERLKQTSNDGYLLSGLSARNATGNRSKAISKRFGRLKRSLGFEDKKHTFHSFRATLASRFQSAGVKELFAARVLGHAAGGMTYGLYAGDLDFDEKVKAMAKVKY